MLVTTLARRNPNQSGSSTATVPSALRFVLSGFRRAVAVMAGASFAGGLAEAVFLVTITRLAFAITDDADRVGIVAGWFLSINETLLLAVALVAVRVALASLAVWQTARVSQSVVARVRKRLASSFLRAGWEVQQRQQGGSLQALIGGFASQASGLMNGVSSGVVAGANLVAMLGLAVAVDPLGSVGMLIAVVLLAAVLRPIRSAVKARARAANRAGLELGVAVNEMSQLGMELHVFHVQDDAEKRLADRIEAVRDRQRRLQFATSSMSTVYAALAYVALLGALAVVAQSNSASLTSLGAVMLVMLRSLSYGQALQGAYVAVVSSSPAVEELLERLDELDAGTRSDGGESVPTLGAIEVENVTFAYPNGAEVLHDVSFRLEAGEVIGIVGPSGGGKSTLVQLLLGLRDPQRGEIRAAGKPIDRFARQEWARKVTFVPQVPHLITGTIADNIRFLRPNITDEELVRAARLAHLHADIEKFEDGYERVVGGKSGADLSGGQQQRLCIARALIEDPELLILDEPTSALDVRSEHLIRETLSDLRGRMTVVVIAHRLSTLDICDRIMVIQDGKVVGFDTPTRLSDSNTFYRDALHLSGLR